MASQTTSEKRKEKKKKTGCSPFPPCPVAQLPPPSSLKSQELYDSSLFNLVPKDTLVRTRINDFCVKLEETVDSKSGKLRLDSWISCRISGISRNRVQSIIKSGIVSVNGKITYKFSHNVKAGDEMDCIILEWKPLRVEPENLPLDIVYEDENVLVVNKPAQMVVHPAPGNATGTLVNGIPHHCSLPTVSNQEVLSDAEDISDDDDGEGLCSSLHVASVRLDKGTS
ncbi:RNA pseudouridine synthase 2, chloroplastic-like [Populus alba]|uniref:RNA pseudouridine synthase 2, chloroplastic-like n=1 Tax=Populus alba TaxID=43335 RepID=UPI00158B30C2|nr:RNA pseudouridine synthase 2, chloroplastic-like [Populus alba]